MRIDRIKIQNFKRFEEQTLELHPKFTLLVGDNGAGKTTLLDALAVAAAVWLVKVPDSTLAGSGRNILRNEIRLTNKKEGDRQFVVLLSSFVKNFQFKWATTQNLIGILNQMTGKDWQPWFDLYVYGSEMPEID